MALTRDDPAFDHAAQARALVAAGVRWVQLRVKGAAPAVWLATAREVVAICHAADALCTINDSVDVALAADADGAHLGALDEDWISARERLGPDRLLGGTVNNAAHARRAAAVHVLDYVGIGPLRFTTTKIALAPLLGVEGIAALLPLLDGLPAWAIGGVAPEDLPALRRAGLSGVAVSGELQRERRIAENSAAFLAAWQNADAAPVPPAATPSSCS